MAEKSICCFCGAEIKALGVENPETKAVICGGCILELMGFLKNEVTRVLTGDVLQSPATTPA